ncbi:MULTISPECIES: cytochrome-c oxidase, cbb3-type subunit III [Phenylobacterium]|uniref:Cbb3-type cytochrome c oxidase subunit n=1 Tax=Phenylobacterium koreense TaxID=266125 RepID=A0ABV2EE06_9CAUL
MSKRESDEVTGVETTGHEWDGIRELDNPLPRWWLWVWYLSIAAAAVYWVLMPAWPGISGYTKGVLGQSDRVAVAGELAALKTVRGAQGAQLATASLEEIERDPQLLAYAQAVGQSVFGDNCATCHGTGGTGAKGYANLRDDVWLWGGKLEDIHHTIQVGIRSNHEAARQSQMPAFGRDQMLTASQISDLTEYVVALSRRPADRAAVARAAPIYQAQCIACHGPTGQGDQALGAPNLTDQEWLYGSSREDIHGQIWNGRGGVMPSWQSRFDPATLKALAVYIHSDAAGQ